MPYIEGLGIIVYQDPLTTTGLENQINEVKQRHAAAIAEAWDYLATLDLDPWEIAEFNLDYNKVRRFWYSPEFGGVYPDHPDAHMALFVELPGYIVYPEG